MVFVLDGAAVALEGLRITGGNAPSGGGIHNFGTVTLTDSSVTDNDPNNCAGNPVAGCRG